MSSHRRPVTSWFEPQPPAAERRAARKRARLEHDLVACAIACEDARRSYTLAVWCAHDPDLHDMFVALLREREQQGEAVEHLLGERSSGSLLAVARRAALEMRVMFGRDDRRILQLCLVAEKDAERAYAVARETVASASRSLEISHMLADHHASLERAIAQLETEIGALDVR